MGPPEEHVPLGRHRQEVRELRKWAPQVLAAKVVGPSHLRDGHPCQDAFAWEWLPDGTLALAVADGAGSAALAHVGSQAAVAGALSGVRNAAEDRGMGDTGGGDSDVMASLTAHMWSALQGARNAVLEAAEYLGNRPRELATTLIVTLWTEVGVVAGHIGDGAVVAWVTNEQGWRVLSAPASGEYANETTFLTEDRWNAQVSINALSTAVGGLVLFTDGCQRAALRRQTVTDGDGVTLDWEPFAPFLQPILRFAHDVEDAARGNAELEALLRSEKLARHSDDDKTLLVLCADRWARRDA